MNNGRNMDHPPGISLVDIYFVVFRRKWLILALSLAGLLAAAVVYFTKQPPYQSSAKVFIRYISETLPTNPGDAASQVTSRMELNQSILNAEVQILTSFDLYEQVATNVGADKILANIGGGNDAIAGADVIARGLKVETSRDSSVIQITFTHPDQTIVRPVLSAIIDAYREKHTQIHQTPGITDDFLMEQTSQLRQQIAQTENELRMVKTNAGIIDIAAAEKSYSEEIARIRRELLQAEAELAERRSTQIDSSNLNLAATKSTNEAATSKIPDETLAKYKTTSTRLDFLQKRLNDLMMVQGYPEENKLVKEAQGQIAEVTKLKSDLEQQFPALATIDNSASSASTSGTSNPGASVPRSLLPARIAALNTQMAQLQIEAAKLGDAEARISELLRKKKVQESHLENFTTTLERAQAAESRGNSLVQQTIPEIQSPTPPFRDFKKYYKMIGMFIFGGFAAGLGLAFLIEFYLDRSIKRPIEVQTKLKIPFFLSIPDLNQGNRRQLPAPARKQLGDSGGKSAIGSALTVKESALEVMAWEVNRRFDSYYDALRDRLVVYFESINLTRKPKLVAVTSTHKGAGVSTIAAGLASSLSETGDGRVLLVDMNLENGAAQQFFRGKPNCKLDDALESETRDGARVQENLYVVTEDTVADKLPRALPKRFAALIPKLKASDYDYIIFDMPPVSPTSVTARLSGFMDTVMLVIESEKTDQQVVQQANALLLQSKANVTAVLNKTRTYIPNRLHKDFLSDV